MPASRNFKKMGTKPVCFIAMAFGKEDTVSLYDKQILPVLKRNGIKPIIINRRQSNQDLNIQIIEQLKNCDFCITDLTYARPSVYYEAGFAEHSVPVIYTVRKDHLKKGQPEDQRVHFDLSMKPLIDWNSPEDTTFANRLESRIRTTFLREWTQRQDRLRKIHKGEEKFSALSQSGRLSLLRRRTIVLLKAIGFRHWVPRYYLHSSIYYPPYKRIMTGSFNNSESWRSESTTFHYVTINAFSSVTKAILSELARRNNIGNIIPYRLPNIKLTIDTVKIDHIIFSIRRIPSSRIEDVLDGYRPNSLLRIYSQFLTNYPLNQKGQSRMIPVSLSWHFISDIRSESDFKEKLNKHIETFVIQKHAQKSR